MATIREINLNINDRDFTVTLDDSGRFNVEGGLTYARHWLTSMDDVKESIASDMAQWAERQPNTPYMSNDERVAAEEAAQRAYENQQKRAEAAEKRTVAVKLSNVPNTYAFLNNRAEEVTVRAVAANRGRRYGLQRGFNITSRATNEKHQDVNVYRLTPELATTLNGVVDKLEAHQTLSEGATESLDRVDDRTVHEGDEWRVTVVEHLDYYHRRNKDAVVYADHKVTFDIDKGVFVADDGTSAAKLDDLSDKLAAAVHPALGKWIITADEGEYVAKLITPEVIAEIGGSYYRYEVVADEATAQTVVANKRSIAELSRQADLIRQAIRHHPSYAAVVLNRDDLVNWPVLGVEILSEDDPEGGDDD